MSSVTLVGTKVENTVRPETEVAGVTTFSSVTSTVSSVLSSIVVVLWTSPILMNHPRSPSAGSTRRSRIRPEGLVTSVRSLSTRGSSVSLSSTSLSSEKR